MFAALRGIASFMWPFGHMVHIRNLESYIKKSGAESWHSYAIRERYKRRHVCLACQWLARALGRDARIFEAGCGSGINLFWLGKRGHRNLEGADISPEALALGRMLGKHLGIKVSFHKDDCLNPQYLPTGVDALLSINWLYHISGASLDDLFRLYAPSMRRGGKIAFDVVDISYNKVKNNEHHTDDWNLQPEFRRPSEYTFRLAPDDVRRIVARYGFTIARQARVGGLVPRTVWLAEWSN